MLLTLVVVLSCAVVALGLLVLRTWKMVRAYRQRFQPVLDAEAEAAKVKTDAAAVLKTQQPSCRTWRAPSRSWRRTYKRSGRRGSASSSRLLASLTR